jgi:hypothetical protein
MPDQQLKKRINNEIAFIILFCLSVIFCYLILSSKLCERELNFDDIHN